MQARAKSAYCGTQQTCCSPYATCDVTEHMPGLQIGDSADAKAQAAEARQEELLTKEFASKNRVEEHRSESHEEVKDGKVTSSSKSESHSSNKSESHSGKKTDGKAAIEGGDV